MLTKQESKFINILSYKRGLITGYLQDLDSYPDDTEPNPEFDGFMAAIRCLCKFSVRRDIVEDYNKELYTENLIKILKENAAVWAELEEFADVDAAYFEQLTDNELFLSDVVHNFAKALNKNEAYLQLYKEIAAAILKEAALEQLKFGPVIDEKYRQICEALGWQVHESLNWFSLCQNSPHGNPVSIFMLNNRNLVNRVWYEFNNFKPEKHVEMQVIDRYRNNNRNLPSLKVLIEDAEAIAAMLEKLARALENA